MSFVTFCGRVFHSREAATGTARVCMMYVCLCELILLSIIRSSNYFAGSLGSHFAGTQTAETPICTLPRSWDTDVVHMYRTWFVFVAETRVSAGGNRECQTGTRQDVGNTQVHKIGNDTRTSIVSWPSAVWDDRTRVLWLRLIGFIELYGNYVFSAYTRLYILDCVELDLKGSLRNLCVPSLVHRLRTLFLKIFNMRPVSTSSSNINQLNLKHFFFGSLLT